MQAISVNRQEPSSKSGLCCTPELRIHLETQLAPPRPAMAPRRKGREATVTVMPRTFLVLRWGCGFLQYDCTVLDHCRASNSHGSLMGDRSQGKPARQRIITSLSHGMSDHKMKPRSSDEILRWLQLPRSVISFASPLAVLDCR